MITVWKYPIEITDEQEIEMPSGAIILHAGLDPTGQPCVWAQLDPNRPLERRKIYVAGTGGPMSWYHDHISTFVDGSFVWHVFSDKTKHMTGK